MKIQIKMQNKKMKSERAFESKNPSHGSLETYTVDQGL
jgi:hypothetical protein